MPRQLVKAFLKQTSPEELLRKGPRVDVRIFLPEEAAALRTNPPDPVEGSALIDTGASSTCISYDVAKALELVPVDEEVVTSPGAQKRHPVYAVTWELKDSGFKPFTNKRVIGVNLSGQDLCMLIGRDFLMATRLHYDGIQSRWQIDIPFAEIPDDVPPKKHPDKRKEKRKNQRKARKKSRKR